MGGSSLIGVLSCQRPTGGFTIARRNGGFQSDRTEADSAMEWQAGFRFTRRLSVVGSRLAQASVAARACVRLQRGFGRRVGPCGAGFFEASGVNRGRVYDPGEHTRRRKQPSPLDDPGIRIAAQVAVSDELTG